jgi:hypothetical protein
MLFILYHERKINLQITQNWLILLMNNKRDYNIDIKLCIYQNHNIILNVMNWMCVYFRHSHVFLSSFCDDLHRGPTIN